jgi:hypothetical protein
MPEQGHERVGAIGDMQEFPARSAGSQIVTLLSRASAAARNRRNNARRTWADSRSTLLPGP